MVNEVFNIYLAVMPVANLAVVHKGPVLPRKWVAVASVDRSASGSADMRKKQLGANMCCDRAQISIVPAGSTSLNTPGVVRWVYQATPNPSPFVTQTDWVAAKLWLTMECS